jgi:Delta14-sterol reductase
MKRPSTSSKASVPAASASVTPSPQQSSFNDNAAPFAYEFGGPVGTLCTILVLPIVIVSLLHWAHVGHVDGSIYMDAISTIRAHSLWEWVTGGTLPLSVASHKSLMSRLLRRNPKSNDMHHYHHWSMGRAMMMCWLWFMGQVLLERCLPCEWVAGAPLPMNDNAGDDHQQQQQESNGKSNKEAPRLLYRINGHLALWVTLLWVVVGWPVQQTVDEHLVWQWKSVPLQVLYDQGIPLAMAAIVWCWMLSIYMYLESFSTCSSAYARVASRIAPYVPHRFRRNKKAMSPRQQQQLQQQQQNHTPKILARGGNSGNAVYDFFMGRELNPRIGTFDWKEFCELRPGLIGWLLLNLSSAYQQHATLGYITGSMYLINIFQGLYVWDALYQERAILTTMDITTDGFGYMLVMGDLAWVPFTYSLQARYLVQHDPHLSRPALLAIVALYALGYYIFRSANSEKDAFRRNPLDPAVRHLWYLPTRRGTRLITSGWWGLARKINYTGDYIMGVTWCLLCGFDSIVPYYYSIYFAILLIHRSIRDDHVCAMKYGEDWERYKTMVPYRFIPYVV